jgi:hypothetical protein
MDPITASILISGGINALQGKRGSDLLKSTISDAALAYATQGASAGASEGISTIPGIDDLGQVGINQYANTGIAQQMANTALQGETFAARDAMNAGDFMQYTDSVQNVVSPTLPERFSGALQTGSETLNKGLDFFRKTDPATGKILSSGEYDKGKVLLGAGALGAGLYAAGAFKPTPAPEPKYPGYNRFYAADPGMFQPFSGRYGPDTGKYPEGSPYSGMQEGGIASPDDMMNQSAMAMTAPSTPISSLYAMAKNRFLPQAQQVEPLQVDTQPMSLGISEISGNLPEALKRKYIMEYKSDPDNTAVKFAQEMKDTDRLSIADINQARKILDDLSNDVKMPVNDLKGILGLVGEGDINVPKAQDAPAYVQKLIDLIQARSVNEPPKAFMGGDMVDVLPSKLIRNENDEMNYKRTSGKLVVDETGKGSGNKDTMLAQLADGEFVTKSKSVLGAGKIMGGKSKEEQRKLGAQFFYKQMAELEKFA